MQSIPSPYVLHSAFVCLYFLAFLVVGWRFSSAEKETQSETSGWRPCSIDDARGCIISSGFAADTVQP